MTLRSATIRTLLFAASAGLLSACGAQAGTGDGTEPAEGVAQAPLGSAAVPAHGKRSAKAFGHRGDDARHRGRDGFRGHGGPGGPERLLAVALRELDLTDAQRETVRGALDEIRAASEAHRAPVAVAAIARSVRAGSVNPKAVLGEAKPAAGDGDRAALARGLQTLHDTLGESQRRSLVDSVSRHFAARRGPAGEDGKSCEGRGMREKGARGGRGPLAHLLAGLALTDAQRASIDEGIAAAAPEARDPANDADGRAAFEKQMHERLESFVGAGFDANAFVTPPSGAPSFGRAPRMQRLVETLAVVVPVLDASQREMLAVKLEQGPRVE